MPNGWAHHGPCSLAAKSISLIGSRQTSGGFFFRNTAEGREIELFRTHCFGEFFDDGERVAGAADGLVGRDPHVHPASHRGQFGHRRVIETAGVVPPVEPQPGGGIAMHMQRQRMPGGYYGSRPVGVIPEVHIRTGMVFGAVRRRADRRQ